MKDKQCVPSRYMVDAADHGHMETAKDELHRLLGKPQLAGIPVGNIKNPYSQPSTPFFYVLLFLIL